MLTGVTPPGSAPHTPSKGSPGSAHHPPLSAPPRLPSTPVNPASISLPATHPYLMSPPASEIKEDERARNYIYQIEGKVRENCRVQSAPSEYNPINSLFFLNSAWPSGKFSEEFSLD